jgi:sec-independent protein translocase protein TatC
VTDNPEARMTFGQHIKELRSRLVKALLAVAVMLAVCIVYIDELVHIMQVPHLEAMTLLKEEYPNLKFDFYMRSFTAPVFARFKLAFIWALFLASPMVGYQMWQFIAAGLFKHEKKWIYLFAPLSFALFVAGCVFGYFILIPQGLYFMAKFADPETVLPLYDIAEYLSLVILLTIITGAIFQIPVVMMFFALLGLVSWKTYLSYWRWAIVLIFVLAAILTPSPDPLSQVLMAGPMLILYFFGIALSAMIGRERQKPAAA